MAFLTQYEADQANAARQQNTWNKIGAGVEQGVDSYYKEKERKADKFEENRRRALDEKRAGLSEGLTLAQAGATPEEINKYKTEGSADTIFKKAADMAEAARQKAIRKDDLAEKLTNSTIDKNNRYGTGASGKMSDREKIDYKHKLRNENMDKQDQERIAAESRRPLIESQKKITDQNINLSNVKNAIDQALTVMNDKTISEDQKVKTGQGLYKLLNSAEGSDAVGAEEAKRIGSYLEYHVGNFTQPGSFIGRDLGGFTDQLKNHSQLLGGRIVRNEHVAKGLREGKQISELTNNAQQPQQSNAPLKVNPAHVKQVQSMSEEDLINFLNGH